MIHEYFAEGCHNTFNCYSHLVCFPDRKNSNLFFLSYFEAFEQIYNLPEDGA